MKNKKTKRNKKKIKPSKYTKHKRVYAKWLSKDGDWSFYVFRNQSKEVVERLLKFKKAKYIKVSEKRIDNPNQTHNKLMINSAIHTFEQHYEAKEVI
ncbi:hypothetical protein [Paenibacillus naphthalenovorans]|uniref:Uncharacterized protein n=1 Tax=Paenibacillus naphthalenovorans TaxID=162209 RepID=A0A0U2W0N4_9BACL|nr:hypothetical protein [Paenibacillus naphthalenovorans]ALS22084.1 hypothetical protein IJ22_17100 [Paenibacillus naphthalenovorans]